MRYVLPICTLLFENRNNLNLKCSFAITLGPSLRIVYFLPTESVVLEDVENSRRLSMSALAILFHARF